MFTFMLINDNIYIFAPVFITKVSIKTIEQLIDVGWGPLDRYGNVGSPLYDTNNYLIVLYKILTTFV
jgi:hypothetical protein